ncbi:MAG: hypothetical protein II876_04765 [Synergistaceae bacterium]|nr:hypothetical protein [Synergistaceae bacterium]MBQ3758756.1 hypothetical protein [Synergistaceae bacterium]
MNYLPYHGLVQNFELHEIHHGLRRIYISCSWRLGCRLEAGDCAFEGVREFPSEH